MKIFCYSLFGLLFVFQSCLADNNSIRAYPPAISWQECDWTNVQQINQTWLGMVPDKPLPKLECAAIEVPLDWTDLMPASGNSTWCPASGCEHGSARYWVRRLSAKNVAHDVSTLPTGQLYLLSGGPGQDGHEHELTAITMAALAQERPEKYGGYVNLDYYIPDHRGTGQSTYLGCPAAETDTSPGGVKIVTEELAPCLSYVLNQYGVDGLSTFSMSTAARDLRYVAKQMIDQAPGASLKTMVYGGSYGTLLANRVLQLEEEPNEPLVSQGKLIDRTILDGVVAPDMYEMLNQVYSGSAVMRVIMSACAIDPVCQSHIGSDPESFLLALFDKLDNGWCSHSGFTSERLRLALGLLPTLANSFISPLALINHLDACIDQSNGEPDLSLVSTLNFVESVLEPGLQHAFNSPGSFLTLVNVAVTQWSTTSAPNVDVPPFLRNLGLQSNPPVVATIYPAMQVTYAQSIWPQFEDAYAAKYPAALKSSVLLFNGGLDANTPIGYAFRAHYQLSKAMTSSGINVGGEVAMPRIMVYEPAGHIILPKVIHAHECMSIFILDPNNDTRLDDCMPFDETTSINYLFQNVPSLDKAILGLDQAIDSVWVDTPDQPGEKQTVTCKVDEENSGLATTTGTWMAAVTSSVIGVLVILVALRCCFFKRGQTSTPLDMGYSLQE